MARLNKNNKGIQADADILTSTCQRVKCPCKPQSCKKREPQSWQYIVILDQLIQYFKISLLVGIDI
uniref:Uncharacterized protein n=1 Tax=Arundo donax TaxID=35708 RepID=A0A0A9DJH8_ARUDO